MADNKDTPQPDEQVEQRSLTSTFVTSVDAGAGLAVGAWVAAKGTQAVDKLTDKLTKKD